MGSKVSHCAAGQNRLRERAVETPPYADVVSTAQPIYFYAFGNSYGDLPLGAQPPAYAGGSDFANIESG
jgi:hypothetical protein